MSSVIDEMMLSALLAHVTDRGSVLDVQYYCDSVISGKCVCLCVCYSKHVWAHKGHGVYTMLFNTGKEAMFIKSCHYPTQAS